MVFAVLSLAFLLLSFSSIGVTTTPPTHDNMHSGIDLLYASDAALSVNTTCKLPPFLGSAVCRDQSLVDENSSPYVVQEF